MVDIVRHKEVRRRVGAREKMNNGVTEHQYNTRFFTNQNLLHPAVFSSKIFNYFFYNVIRFCNTIPVTAKKLDSVSEFKKYLMKHVFDNR